MRVSGKIRIMAVLMLLLVLCNSVGTEYFGVPLFAEDMAETTDDEDLSLGLDELGNMDNLHLAGSAEENISMDAMLASLDPEAYVGNSAVMLASDAELYSDEEETEEETETESETEAETEAATEETTEAETETTTDGTWVFSMHYVEDDVSNYYHLNETGDFTVKYQFEFSSGFNIDKGKAVIRFNKSLFTDINGDPINPSDIGVPAFADGYPTKDENGNYDTTSLTEGSTSISTSPFNYYYETGEDGEEYIVFVNYRTIMAGTSTAVQVLYDNIKAFDVVDMTEWTIDADVQVGDDEISTEDGDITPLTGQVDTSVSITSFNKEEYNDPTVSYTPALYTVKQVNKFAGTNLTSLDDDYIYLVYKMTIEGTANQRFDLYLNDLVPSYGEVVGVTKGSNFTAAKTETVTIDGVETTLWDVGYYYVTSSDISGYNSDKTKDTIYNSEKYSVDAYVVVRYKTSDIPDEYKKTTTYTDDYGNTTEETVYTLSNSAVATISPYDQKDVMQAMNNNAAETGDATPAETSWQNYHWSYNGTHGGDDVNAGGTSKARKDNKSADLYGWLEEYNLHKNADESYSGSLSYTVSSAIQSYEATHQNMITGDYETYTGGYVHFVTADDVLYVTDTDNTQTQLTSDDYYITSITVTAQDKGRDVWEDTDASPTVDSVLADVDTAPTDRDWYVYGKSISTDEWEEIGQISWSDNGGEVKASFAFDADKYYRVKVEHNTVDYSSSCKIDVAIAIKDTSPVFATLLSNWNEDSTYSATLTDYAAVGAYEVNTATTITGHGDGTSVIKTESDTTLPSDATGDMGDDAITEPYRVSAAYNLLPITEIAEMKKVVDEWYNDTNNARVTYSYTIGAYDGYRVFSQNVADEIIKADDEKYTNLDNRTSVVIYDLLPYKVHYDGSVSPKVAHITNTSALNNSSSTSWSEENVTLTSTDITPNYNNTGRELVAFTLTYTGTDAATYKNSAWTAAYGVQFGAYVTWNNYEYARGKDNIAAYTSANDVPLIGAKYNDQDPSAAGTQYTDFGTGLDKNDTADPTLYASANTSAEIAISAKSGIEKLVRSESGADVASSFSNTATVEYNGTYTYQISVSNANNSDDSESSVLTDIIILDKLEDGVNQRYEDEKNSETSVFHGLTEKPTSWWNGTINSINLSAVDSNHEIKIYYNTNSEVEMPDYLTEVGVKLYFVQNGDTYDLKKGDDLVSSGWQLLATQEAYNSGYTSFEGIEDVAAIAVDLGEFELPPMSSATMDITMTAPSTQIASAPYAYNNPAYYAVIQNTDTSQAENGNAVKVRIGSTDELIVAKEFTGNTLANISKYPSLRSTQFTFKITDEDGNAYADKQYKLWTYSGESEPSGTEGTDWIEHNGKYFTAERSGEYITTDAKGQLTLLANQIATLDVIGVQNFKVVETLNDNWQLYNIKKQSESDPENIVESEASITVDGKANVRSYTFENVYKSVLSVTKSTVGVPSDISEEDSSKKTFTYKAEFLNSEGTYEPLAGYTYKHGSTTDKTDEEGKFSFAANETALIYLPDMLEEQARITEVLTDEEQEDWKCTQSDVSLTVKDSGNKAAFENVYQHKYLDITKELTHQMAVDCTENFSFEIYSADGTKVTEFDKVYLIDGDGTSKELTATPDDEGNVVTDGTITAHCADKTIRVEYLDANTTYTVKEVDIPDDYAPNGDGTAQKTMPNKAAGTSVNMINDYLWRGLSVTKRIVAEQTVADYTKQFTLYLYKDGSPVAGAAYTSDYNDGGTTASDGSFTIYNGETVTFEKIGKTGTEYQIAEKVDDTYYPLSLNYTGGAGSVSDFDTFTLGSDGKTDYDYEVTNGSEGFLALSKQYDMPSDTSEDIKEYLQDNPVTFKFTVTNGTLNSDWLDAINGISKDGITASGNTVSIPVATGSNVIINTNAIAELDAGETVLKYTLTEEIPDAVKSFYVGGTGCKVTNSSGSSISGTEDDRIVTVTNKLETMTGVAIYKYEYSATMSGKLVFKLQNADGTPVSGIKYIAVAPNGTTLTDIEQTDDNGYAYVNVSSANAFKIIFETDKNIVINPTDNVSSDSYRLTELVSESSGCGYLVGFDKLASYSGETESDQFATMTDAYKVIDEIPYVSGADTFVNAKATQEVQLAKAEIDGETTSFTFKLKQLMGGNEYTANGITYSVYTIDGDTLVSSGNMVDENGELTVEAGQYALLTLPKYTKWRVYEKSTVGYNLLDIEASGFNTVVDTDVTESTTEITTEANVDEDANDAQIVKRAKTDLDAYGRYVYNNSSSYAEWSNDDPQKIVYTTIYPAVLVRNNSDYKYCFCNYTLPEQTYEEYYADMNPDGRSITKSQYTVDNSTVAIQLVNDDDGILALSDFVDTTAKTVTIPDTINAYVGYTDLDAESRKLFKSVRGFTTDEEAETSGDTVQVSIPVVAINNSTSRSLNGSGVFEQKITSDSYTLNLGSNLKYIGEEAFYGCTGLSNIVIPDSVEVIGGRAFCGVGSLDALHVGTGVKYIDIDSLRMANDDSYECSDFAMGSNIEKKGAGAFGGTYYTDSFVLNNIKYWGSQKWESYQWSVKPKTDNTIEEVSITFDNNCTFSSNGLHGTFASSTGSVFTINKLTLNLSGAISDYAFSSAFRGTDIYSMTLDFDRVTSIGRYAFAYVFMQNYGGFWGDYGEDHIAPLNGETVELNLSNVTSIGAYAFNEAFYLRANLTISNKLESIGEGAFRCCRRLTGEMDLSGVTQETIANNTYTTWYSNSATSISKLTIGASIKTLNSWAFNGLNDLKTVVIKDRSSSITGTNAFTGNYSYTASNRPIKLVLEISEEHIDDVEALITNLDNMGLKAITNIEFTQISSLSADQLTALGLTDNGDGTYSVGTTSTSITITYGTTTSASASYVTYTPALAARREELTIEI